MHVNSTLPITAITTKSSRSNPSHPHLQSPFKLKEITETHMIPQTLKVSGTRRTRRIVAAAAAVSLAVTLAACSSSNGNDAAQTLSKSTKGTLTVWTYLDTSGAGAQAVAAQNALFAKQFPHVKVDVVQIPSSSEDSKLLTSATAQNGPDVVQDNPDADLYELASSGAIADMTSYWKNYAQASEFPSSALWKYKGNIVTAQSYTNLLGIWYNKTLLSSLGLKPATTITQLNAQLPKIKAAGDTGLMFDAAPGLANSTWQMYPWLTATGASFCSLDGKPAKQALSQLSDWSKKGYISSGATTWDNQDITTSGFLDGKTAYVEDGNWASATLATSKLPFQFGSEPMFSGPSGSHVLPGGEGWAIGGFSKQKQLAFDYITDSWLSKAGGADSVKYQGVLPTRKDVAPVLSSQPLVSPFLPAVKTAAAWPSASQANKAETDLSNVLSGIMGGSISASAGASQAATLVKNDIASGTGTCHG
jgi:ABC-type glycerol-3-phosphate transport system substrate-binding protein